MAEKTKRAMPWLILGVFLVFACFLNLCFELTQVSADSTTPSVTVGAADPTVGSVSLNGGNDISLVESNTTSTVCTATITDTNGGADISSATATIHYSAATNGATCTADDRDCYQIAGGSCSLGGVVGNTKSVTCTAAIEFFATATDTFVERWECRIQAVDASGGHGSATNTTETVDLATLEALTVESSISYDTLSAGASSSDSVTVTATTTGNVQIDLSIAGEALKVDSDTLIDVPYQEYALADFYHSDGNGTDLATTTATLKIASGIPTSNPSDASDITYWTLYVPLGQAAGTYSGTTTIDATTNTG